MSLLKEPKLLKFSFIHEYYYLYAEIYACANDILFPCMFAAEQVSLQRFNNSAILFIDISSSVKLMSP